MVNYGLTAIRNKYMTKVPDPKNRLKPIRVLTPLAIALLLSGCQTLNTPLEPVAAERPPAAPPTPMVEPILEPLEELEQPINIDNLWDRIQAGLSMDLDQNNPRIYAELKWYKQHSDYFSQIAQRAKPYLHFIVEEVETREIPLELALMPIVESSFDPFALSHAGASGLWQFMPGTAKHFGLKKNWWYDGRRDVIHSTRAALDYMQKLHKRFNDWELALAAFNSGPGRVQRAINKNKKLGQSTHFWALDLPSETTAYVPKLIALGKVIRNPEKYEVTLPHIPNEPYFDKVDIIGQLDITKAAQLSKVAVDDLYLLNPGLNRWSTPPEGPHHLVVPTTHAEHFRTQLATLPPENRLTWHRYTVQNGDSLSTIAYKHRTSVNVLLDANKLDDTLIRTGQNLLIPMADGDVKTYTLSVSQRRATRQNRAVRGRQKVEYRVKSGDSLWVIAANYDVGVNELARWNGMSPQDTLSVNQKLVIWKKKSNPNEVVRKVNYTVRSGDSLAKIASRFNVNVTQIQDWNTDLNGKYIHPGQLVTLFVNITRNH